MFERARERSAVCRLLATGRKRVRTATERSALTRVLGVGGQLRDPTDSRSESFRVRPLERGVARSRIRTVLAPVTDAGMRIQRSVSSSRLIGFVTRCKRCANSSAGYRWLTAEPEPDVIVVDLRETRTVGPVVRTIDRTVRELAAGAPSSAVAGAGIALAAAARDRPLRAVSAFGLLAVLGSLLATGLAGALSGPLLAVYLLLVALAALGLRSTRHLDDLLETRIVRVLTAAFEPPKPPATTEPTETNGDTDVGSALESAGRSTDGTSSDGGWTDRTQS